MRYAVTLPDCDAEVRFTPFIDADVRNADANYDEKFWTHAATEPDAVCMRTLRSGFGAAWAQVCRLDGARRHGGAP